jgi:hypothetical protein
MSLETCTLDFAQYAGKGGCLAGCRLHAGREYQFVAEFDGGIFAHFSIY